IIELFFNFDENAGFSQFGREIPDAHASAKRITFPSPLSSCKTAGACCLYCTAGIMRMLPARSGWLFCAITPLALAMGGWTIARHAERQGAAFFERGRSVCSMLDRFAHAAKARDTQSFAEFFASDYQGRSMGFKSFTSIDAKDGVRRLAMCSSG